MADYMKDPAWWKGESVMLIKQLEEFLMYHDRLLGHHNSCRAAELRAMIEKVKQLQADLETVRKLADAQAHLIVIEGIIPGKWRKCCRCDKCRLVAKAMARAEYIKDVIDCWWEKENTNDA